MAGSGLLELLELVYAQNAVGHMPSGKAISRPVRGHLLVDSALNALLTAKAFGVSVPDILTPEAKGQTNTASDHSKAESDSIRTETEFGMDESVETDTENEQLPEDLNATIKLYDKLTDNDISVDSVCSESVLDRVQQRIQDQSSALNIQPTARLW